MKSLLFLLIGILGIILFVLSFFVRDTLKHAELQASRLDDKKTSHAVVSEDSPPPCSWEVKKPERVMAENKSQAIVVTTKNNAKKNCETYLLLRAPGFDMNPPKEEQKVTLSPGKNGSIAWILTPRKTGTYDMTVTDIINTSVFGVTVTNVYGMTAAQAKFLSSLSTFLGPMLTVPWWWDRWRQRKQKQENKKQETGEKQ